jgi:parallel beta-helix repeat protein
MLSFVRALFLIALTTILPFASYAQSPSLKLSIVSLSTSSPTVSPGQTVSFTAVLNANQSVSGYPIEFSLVGPGSTAGVNTVVYATYQANQTVKETTSWTVPSNAAPGSYKLYVNAYDPSWDVPALASTTAVFSVSGSSSLAPLAVTLNSLTATPTVAQPGQTVTLTAALTANQSASGLPVEISIIPPGSSTGQNTVMFANYQAGQKVTETTSWTIPLGTKPGAFKVVLGAYNSAWSTPALANGSTGFVVNNSVSAEKPGPSASLYASPFYTCSRNFYVATNGNDSNTGTLTSPWLTIQHADSSSRQPGDCVMVAPGIYEAQVLIQNGGNAPTPTGYVVYRCEALDACHILAPTTGHLWGFANKGNFVVVDGFEVDGNDALKADGIADACFGSDASTYGTGKSSHHIWILNNIIHHCNLAGVSFNNKEWYYVQQNIVYHNSWTSGYQGSGIDFVVVQCIEKQNSACASGATYSGGTGNYVPSGMDITYMPNFHNVVAGNVVYNNMISSNNPVGCGAHTDGNGIIMDTFFDMATLSIVYPYQTLVSNNISFSNGGRGIHVFRTSNVTVANNTAFSNGTDTCMNAYYLADLSQAGGSNNNWINNIAQSEETASNPSCGAYCGNRNTPFVAGNGAGIVDKNNTYADNVTFGGYGVQLFDNDTSYFSCSSNKCGTNPMMIGPTSGNFALQSASPVLAYGELLSYVPAQAAYPGACSSALESCP